MKPESPNKILIISFHFPPSTLVGAKRFAFLSQILQEKYNDVNLLTIKEKYISPKDRTLKFAGTVHRTAMYPSYNPIEKRILKRIFSGLWKRYLCGIDPFSGWILPALIKGFSIVKKENIDVLIATGPPFSPMIIGLLLSKMTSTKLILDYRDPWTNQGGRFRHLIRLRLNEHLERIAAKQASALVFCSRLMKDNFVKRFGNNFERICFVITNGFCNIRDIQPLSLGEFKKNMIYAGNFYGERRIKILVNALTYLIDEGIITKENFRFHIFGKICREDKLTIKEYGLQSMVKEYPRVSYERLIRYLRGADILFLPSGSDVKYAIPFKFFDYLSVQRPILGVAPENSAVANIMREIDCGRVAVINNDESILSNVRAMLIEGDKHTYLGAQHYTWEQITKRYFQVIDDVAKVGQLETQAD